jgi:superfamily II DNA or RNA helicase
VRENGKNVLKPNKVFATRIANREFRFHIGQYDDFIKFISYENLTPEHYEVIVKPMYEPATFKSKVNSKFEEREYQTQLINFLVNEEIGDNRSRLVGLQTGQGKTFCSLSAVSKLTTRTMIVVLGRYMQKWTSDVSEILNVDPKEIIVLVVSLDTAEREQNVFPWPVCNPTNLDLLSPISSLTRKFIN